MNTTKEETYPRGSQESLKRKKSKKKKQRKDEIFAGNRREMSIVLQTPAEMFDLAKAKNKSEVKKLNKRKTKNKDFKISFILISLLFSFELVYNFWWQ